MEQKPQNIKHWKNEKDGYYCMGDESKVARTLKEVTCNNCIKLLKLRVLRVKGKKK
jgi:hypothetical protein